MIFSDRGDTSDVTDSLIAERIGDVIDLTPGERAMLARLEQRTRAFRRGSVFLREKERHAELFIVKSGMMMSYVLLPDGSRQILRFIFPGEIGGLPSLLYARVAETVAAVTEAVIAPFERSLMSELVAGYPRLAGYFLAMSQMERLALTDRLAALGRTSAKARIAALLLELRDRMRVADKTVGDQFALTLTQEEIGDATGLTAVHVNRMLRQLEEDGLIARRSGHLALLDAAGLASVSNYTARFNDFDLAWLPVAR